MLHLLCALVPSFLFLLGIFWHLFRFQFLFKVIKCLKIKKIIWNLLLDFKIYKMNYDLKRVFAFKKKKNQAMLHQLRTFLSCKCKHQNIPVWFRNRPPLYLINYENKIMVVMGIERMYKLPTVKLQSNVLQNDRA